MTTTDTPTTIRVVRREPEVFEAREDGLGKYWMSPNSEYFSVERFHATFIPADQYEAEQHNSVIGELIAEAEQKVERYSINSPHHEMLRSAWSSRAVWLRSHLRPTPSEGVSHE